MTNIQTKSKEKRKAPRHGRSLRVAWRLLGNRHMRYGEAALKDIGTNGMALLVDEYCPKGSVVIVQFTDTPERFAEPMLLQAEWTRELQTKDGEPQTFLVGCSFTTPMPEKDLNALLASVKNAPPAPSKKASEQSPAPLDPFQVGSASEKRTALRRKGLTVNVVIWRTEVGTPVEASVVDRSLHGLGILTYRPFTRGTVLHVRPCDVSDNIPSVQVQVRNCRLKGKQWFLGCNFHQTPPANLLILLG